MLSTETVSDQEEFNLDKKKKLCVGSPEGLELKSKSGVQLPAMPFEFS
jgi:hypothetical protein